MLWFVGTGIDGYRGLSLAATDVLKKCDVIYVERFTSALSDNDLKSLNSLLGKSANAVQRWFVEDGRQILEVAKTKQVALVVYGDPLIATTHTELRARAARSSISTAVLHAASGIASTIGETGLHVYKFGRMVTMMSDPRSAVSVYDIIFQNLLSGSHTLILTEYSQKENDEPFFLDPSSLFRMLLDVEKDQKNQILSNNTYALVATRIGMVDQRITSGNVGSLLKIDFGPGPHTVIVTGSLHFTEVESIAALTEKITEPSDNSLNVRRLSEKMVERYAPKAKQAVRRMREMLRENESSVGVLDVLDNAECYVADAERFQRQAKFELAVLSLGYAEGLVDALRFQKGLNPWQT